MKKLKIKNEIVSLFNSVDSTTLNSKGQAFHIWLSDSVKVVEKSYEKISKEDLLGCLNFAKVFVEDIEQLKK